MDLEAPADAWYVWVGVAIVSTTLFGLALSLPSDVPPDANKAANSIDDVAGSAHQATAEYEHGADKVKVETHRLSMKNDGGTARSSVVFGPLTPISEVSDQETRAAFEQILSGEDPSVVIDESESLQSERDLVDAAENTRDRLNENGATWRSTDGVLHVRKLTLDEEPVVLVDL